MKRLITGLATTVLVSAIGMAVWVQVQPQAIDNCSPWPAWSTVCAGPKFAGARGFLFYLTRIHVQRPGTWDMNVPPHLSHVPRIRQSGQGIY